MFFAVIGWCFDPLEESAVITADTFNQLIDKIEAFAKLESSWEDDENRFCVEEFIHKASSITFNDGNESHDLTDITLKVQDAIEQIHESYKECVATTQRHYAEHRQPI